MMGPGIDSFEIRLLTSDPDTLSQLCDLITEVVAAGGSVSFMHPLAAAQARAFWAGAMAAAARGERLILGAWVAGCLISTVTLLLDCPPNQPHRAEIAKMMTRPEWRGRGAASALLREAEAQASARQRTLIVLDTASDGGAAGLYEKHGYQLAGEIPGYALKPHGGLTGTLMYWKRLKLEDKGSR
ncbi:N-acetyltransferase [Deinococcus sp.]|uniref:GNAT family N-acetyltransferase n=1 Tax=Deinococcus sp. TaxID=47478 RepID=UPI0025F0EF04|nr:N-acetyltransferase [Deinococcus sp.]